MPCRGQVSVESRFHWRIYIYPTWKPGAIFDNSIIDIPSFLTL
jgi:hypothetical protein